MYTLPLPLPLPSPLSLPPPLSLTSIAGDVGDGITEQAGSIDVRQSHAHIVVSEYIKIS